MFNLFFTLYTCYLFVLYCCWLLPLFGKIMQIFIIICRLFALQAQCLTVTLDQFRKNLQYFQLSFVRQILSKELFKILLKSCEKEALQSEFFEKVDLNQIFGKEF